MLCCVFLLDQCCLCYIVKKCIQLKKKSFKIKFLLNFIVCVLKYVNINLNIEKILRIASICNICTIFTQIENKNNKNENMTKIT